MIKALLKVYNFYFRTPFFRIKIEILLHAKSKQKVIGNSICTPIIFKNPLETGFSLRNILITVCVRCVFDYIELEDRYII